MRCRCHENHERFSGSRHEAHNDRRLELSRSGRANLPRESGAGRFGRASSTRTRWRVVSICASTPASVVAAEILETADILAMPAGPSLAVLAPRGAFPRATRGMRRRVSSSMIPRALARPTPGASIPSDAPVSRAMRDLAPRDHVPGNHLFQTAAETAVARTLPAPKPLTIAGVPVTTFAAGAGVAYSPRSAPASGSCAPPPANLWRRIADKLNMVQRRPR